jgi:hypothetical protein
MKKQEKVKKGEKRGGLTPQGECTLPEEGAFPCLNFPRVKFRADIRGMNPACELQEEFTGPKIPEAAMIFV